MSQICIFENSLDATEQRTITTNNVLKTFLNIRSDYPQARIYKGNPCGESDVTPTADNKESIARLLESNQDFTIVCHPGDVISAVNWAFGKIVGAAVNSLVRMPKINDGKSTGSSNNNLANAENTQRIKERVPRVIGHVKSIPDLFAPAYRYFKDGVEVEELLLCVCENDVELTEMKEGDTPVADITGKSITAYGLNQSIIGKDNIYKLGDDFTEAPIIAKQIKSINGQTLLTPNSTKVERGDIYFRYPNLIKTWEDIDAYDQFSVGEEIIVEGASYSVVNDAGITGAVTINADKTIQISTSQSIANYQDYRKINITSMLVSDEELGQLDLAGLYNVGSITYYNGTYTILLINPSSTNTNFSRVTTALTTTISANLTSSSKSIVLDGTYVITGISRQERWISIATPSVVNSDWINLQHLPSQQIGTSQTIKLRGSQDNFIGWFTSDVKTQKGLLLNFKAPNGLYQGSHYKHVTIEVDYQNIVNGEPVGNVFKTGITIRGKANSRDAVGGSIWIDLPFEGAVRFRAKRITDHGDAADLMDETKFYSAFSYHKLRKLVYSDRVLIRSRTIATPNATSQESRQLNCIAQSLVYSYRGGSRSPTRIPSRNIADLAIDLALHPRIGRRVINEININDIYQAVNDIQAYFGSEKMAEFNYTLDNTNTSFEEMMRMMAAATCSHDRRINRNIYFELESADNVPLILFNHRNKKAKSEFRKYSFRPEKNYDGIELTYVDSENGWVEKTLKVPSEFLNNPKKVDATGVVYTQQAHIIAWREWNKIQFNRIATTFTAFCESDLVARGDTVLCTDDTRVGNNESDGEVLEWSGNIIRGSQPFNVGSGHVIHLQLKSGQIDVIPISQGMSPYHFVLGRVPRESLITVGEVKTTYSVTTDAKRSAQKFLVASKKPIDIFENEVTAINWDARYYRNDKDIINNLI